MNRGSKHIAGLDAVRGLAIALVLFSHLVIYRDSLSSFRSLGLSCGQAGVSVFFVLSGFFDNEITSYRKGTFWNINYFCFTHVDVRDCFSDVEFPRINFRALFSRFFCPIILALVHFLSLLFRNLVGHGHETAHLWSLSVEEQFYLVWPLIVGLANRSSAVLFCSLACVMIIPIWRLIAYSLGLADEGSLYMRPDFRFDSILFGALLACCNMNLVLVEDAGLLLSQLESLSA